MTQKTTELLMVAFGGPTPGCCERFETCPGEAYCFVSGIFGHNDARRERIAEVVDHYQELGGYSAFNTYTAQQADALVAELERRGIPMRVRCGYHHWPPYVRDVIAEMSADGVTDIVLLIMAPHQSSVSWDLYLRIVGEGLQQVGERAPRVVGVIEPWWNMAGFVDAVSSRIDTAAKAINADLHAPETGLLLTAHAIPQPVSRTAPYCTQVQETAALVAQKLGVKTYTVAYQSQPTVSTIPWTGPSVEEAIAAFAAAGKTKIVSSAIGFLCDNVEVLYDLGIEGKRRAEAHGLTFTRAESVHSHPAFIRMLADRVEAKLNALQVVA
jgi:ferrochelatase